MTERKVAEGNNADMLRYRAHALDVILTTINLVVMISGYD